MLLIEKERIKVSRALRALDMLAPEQRVEDFVSEILALTVAQRLQYFPAASDAVSLTIGQLTEERESILRDDTTLPTFAIYQTPLGEWVVSGFSTYLSSMGFDPQFVGRLKHFQKVRSALVALARGHDLEALGAAILSRMCDYGEATRGSGDQGIDAIGKKDLLPVHHSFYDGGLGSFALADPVPGDNVFLLVSSKAVIGARNARQKLITPAHIRELVGAWLIQRDDVGKWRAIGIRMLSPMQLVLITTYRLSDESTNECRKLGIQVWGMPQLIYLICMAAPADVFDQANAFTFSMPEFRKWWRAKDVSRLRTPEPA